MKNFPGTNKPKNHLSGKQFLDGMFNGTSGLVMSQIKEFTDLTTPAIQNWVNRGWVSRPVNKRYDENQVARILIINTLRSVMSLESVAKLLYYVNGVAGDERDDIIYESELYGYVCDIIFSDADDKTVDGVILNVTDSFKERRSGDKARLTAALKIVYLSCKAIKYVNRSARLLSEITG